MCVFVWVGVEGVRDSGRVILEKLEQTFSCASYYYTLTTRLAMRLYRYGTLEPLLVLLAREASELSYR